MRSWLRRIMVVALASGLALLTAPRSDAQVPLPIVEWQFQGTLLSNSPLPATTLDPHITLGLLSKSSQLTEEIANAAYVAIGWPGVQTTRHPQKYMEIVAVPEDLYRAELYSLDVQLGGVTTHVNWEVRSSLDGFATTLDAGVVSVPGPLSFQVDLTGLGVITEGISFRVYYFNNMMMPPGGSLGFGGVLRVRGTVEPNGAVAVDPRSGVFRIEPSRPNPFTTSTQLAFELPAPQRVSLSVHDLSGRRIRSIANRVRFAQGRHELAWDGRAADGSRSPAGIYFLRMRAGTADHVIRVTRLD